MRDFHTVARARGFSAVKNMLDRTAPLFASNPQMRNGLIDISVDPLTLFDEYRTFKQAASFLNTVAATGLYTIESLDRFYQLVKDEGFCGDKSLLYYLASLYLQVDEQDKVDRLLMSSGRASVEMMWFAALMIYARRNGFDLPRQEAADTRCLDYLEQRLQDSEHVMDNVLSDTGTIAVIGNAPGVTIESAVDGSRQTICFNDYRKNERLTDIATIHVVTPSWDFTQANGEQRLFITGNNIFYRRSRVWQRFSHAPDYLSVSCFPKELWSSLYQRLKAPPSAGLLMIQHLSGQQFTEQSHVQIGGFSVAASAQNHSYDRVPASGRHDWAEEVLQREAALDQIKAKVASLQRFD